MSGSHASFPFQGNYDPYDYGTHMPEQGSSNSNGGGYLAAGGGGGPGDKPSDDKRPRAVSKTIRTRFLSSFTTSCPRGERASGPLARFLLKRLLLTHFFSLQAHV